MSAAEVDELDELPELDTRAAVREVGWIAREVRELVHAPGGLDADPARAAAFFRRKARLLRHIAGRGSSAATPAELAAQAAAADAEAARYAERARDAAALRELDAIRAERWSSS